MPVGNVLLPQTAGGLTGHARDSTPDPADRLNRGDRGEISIIPKQDYKRKAVLEG